MPASIRRAVVLATLALTVAACGGGGGSSGPSEAPVISGLQVVPGPSRTFTITVDFTDAQGDVFGGQCTLQNATGAITAPINRLAPGVSANATQGTVTCFFQVNPGTPSGITLSGEFLVTDADGHQSNGLAVVITTEARGGASSTGDLSVVEPGGGIVGR